MYQLETPALNRVLDLGGRLLVECEPLLKRRRLCRHGGKSSLQSVDNLLIAYARTDVSQSDGVAQERKSRELTTGGVAKYAAAPLL